VKFLIHSFSEHYSVFAYLSIERQVIVTLWLMCGAAYFNTPIYGAHGPDGTLDGVNRFLSDFAFTHLCSRATWRSSICLIVLLCRA